MAFKEDHNIFVGSLLGSFKGLKLEKKDGAWRCLTKNFSNVNNLDTSRAITAMAWGDDEQKDVILGLADQTVKVYDTNSKAFESSLSVGVGKGKICGISRFKGVIVVAVESGCIKVMGLENETKQDFDVGGPLEKMKHCAVSGNIIATGGKEKDLQLWDLEYKTCTFQAKNVRHNYLELRVPVWVTDLDFISNTNKVVTCSRYGHVRIYDSSGSQRRPAFDFNIPDQVLTACSVSPCGSKIIVGSGTGHMCAVDIRGKGLLHHRYKGSVGSIRSICCHPFEKIIVSVGLDRFVKIHAVESPKLLHKEYLKTKLNCVLVRKDFYYKHQKETEPVVDSECEIIDSDSDEIQSSYPESKEKRAYDKLFDNMEKIIDCKTKKVKKMQSTI